MAEKPVYFILGIHNHQPVGNFDHVFDNACRKAYEPFLEVAQDHPRIALSLHFSGPLLEWLEQHRPHLLELVERLVQRENVELLGAGFYEPILSMIPERDRLGQLEKMKRYLKQRFNYQLEGGWLTERVWEPHLARTLAVAGYKYVVVDDYHFMNAGWDPEKLIGYFYTEEEGYRLGLFPIRRKLRYSIPYAPPEETIAYLRSYQGQGDHPLLVMADDGEKFGLWPGTHQLVYRQRWLDRFFTLLEQESDWLKTVTFKEYFSRFPPQGLVYLPTASYFEMSQWSLPADKGSSLESLIDHLRAEGQEEAAQVFIRGGFWRNFLSKYEEANWMQKRVNDVSHQLASLNSHKPSTAVWDELYQAQCNCAFWHGVFGGLYLPHLRHAIFQHLLAAEEALTPPTGTRQEMRDIDFDGAPEIIWRDQSLQVIIKSRGGAIRELDWLPGRINLTNTLQRHPESYHRKLSEVKAANEAAVSIHDQVQAKESDLDRKLFIDTYPRWSLLDHFFKSTATLRSFHRGELPERGHFYETLFQAELAEEVLALQASGAVDSTIIHISKNLRLSDDKLAIEIVLKNIGERSWRGRYGVEWNFGLLAGQAPDRYYQLPDSRREPLAVLRRNKNLDFLEVVNESDGFRIKLNFKKDATLWRAPIETVSMSESGFERVYQASSLLIHWPLHLVPGAEWQGHMELQVEAL